MTPRPLPRILTAAVAVLTLTSCTPTTDPSPATPNASSQTAVSGTAGDTPAPDDQFESWDIFNDEFSKTARVAAEAACSWSKLTDESIIRRGYETAGMSADLAAEYTPVWAEVFASDSVASAEIWCNVNGQPGINEVSGTEGSYVWRVGVTVTYEGTWVHNAAPDAQGAASATWWLTIEQKTGKVIAIDQPSPTDVQIRIKEEE